MFGCAQNSTQHCIDTIGTPVKSPAQPKYCFVPALLIQHVHFQVDTANLPFLSKKKSFLLMLIRESPTQCLTQYLPDITYELWHVQCLSAWCILCLVSCLSN